MGKYKELIAVSLVFLSIVGTIVAIFSYESVLAKRRGTIELEAHPIATWSKKEIRVKQGELVKIRVINKDCVTHGFAIPELDVDERIIKAGQFEIVEFTPKYAGEYTYLCVVQCDREQHEFMRGKLIVESSGQHQLMSHGSKTSIVGSWVHETGDITLTFAENSPYSYIYDDGDCQYKEYGTYSISDNILNTIDSEGYSCTETFTINGNMLTLIDEDGYSQSFSRLSSM